MCCGGRLDKLTRKKFRPPPVVVEQVSDESLCPTCGTVLLLRRGCCGKRGKLYCPNKQCTVKEVR